MATSLGKSALAGRRYSALTGKPYIAPTRNPESTKAIPNNDLSICFYGAGTRDRTGHLPLTRRLLYQMSYAGAGGIITKWQGFLFRLNFAFQQLFN